jgi:hypothetical protein
MLTRIRHVSYDGQLKPDPFPMEKKSTASAAPARRSLGEGGF